MTDRGGAGCYVASLVVAGGCAFLLDTDEWKEGAMMLAWVYQPEGEPASLWYRR